MRIIPIILIAVSSLVSAAEHPPGYIELIDLSITVRVDTTDADVRAVYDLVRNFLSTRPDSLYDNPYWNDSEKKKYADPFPARRMIFQSSDIVRSFPPKVLSIEKEGDYYCIRTLFYRENLEEPYKSSNPWAIQRLYAKKVEIKKKKGEKTDEETQDSSQVEEKKKEDIKEFRLFDPLRILTKDWKRERIGPIEYYYPFNHYFDRRAGNAMAQFCRGMRNKYGVPNVEPIEFYICRSVDEMAQIVGLDYFLGPTSGRTHAPNAQVFTALGSEWYPHEVMHVYFRDYKPHFILMEGVATYEGGSMNKSFDSMVVELAEYLNKNDTITFQQILDSPYLEGGSMIFYTVGAVLCKMADQKGGPALVKVLLESGIENEQLYQKIEAVLGIPQDKVTEVLRAKVKEYTGK